MKAKLGMPLSVAYPASFCPDVFQEFRTVKSSFKSSSHESIQLDFCRTKSIHCSTTPQSQVIKLTMMFCAFSEPVIQIIIQIFNPNFLRKGFFHKVVMKRKILRLEHFFTLWRNCKNGKEKNIKKGNLETRIFLKIFADLK